MSAIAPQNAASFSRGLVDTYFRQMGNAGALSREEVIALAKRIEASQRAMLTGLCGVPMLIERIACWGMRLLKGDGVWRVSSICPSPGTSRAPSVGISRAHPMRRTTGMAPSTVRETGRGWL